MLDIVLEYLKIVTLCGLALAFFLTLCSYSIKIPLTFEIVNAHWHQTFDGIQLSAEEFYKTVSDAIALRELPGVSVKSTSHPNASLYSGIFKPNQKCLHIKMNTQLFILCAAPYGTAYYVSWWQGEPVSFLKDFFTRLPFIGRAIAALTSYRSFHDIEVTEVFLDIVQKCILDTLDDMLEEKGTKPISGTSRQIPILPLQKVG
jgi:hypothetical protein